jgi:hypothetical protein
MVLLSSGPRANSFILTGLSPTLGILATRLASM